MSENSNNAFKVILMLAGLLVGQWFSSWVMGPFGRSDTREALVRAGHAEYYLDADNVRQWRLKPMGEWHPWPWPPMRSDHIPEKKP